MALVVNFKGSSENRNRIICEYSFEIWCMHTTSRVRFTTIYIFEMEVPFLVSCGISFEIAIYKNFHVFSKDILRCAVLANKANIYLYNIPIVIVSRYWFSDVGRGTSHEQEII